MFNQKVEHRRLISCLIISIIIIFLNNNSIVGSNTIACSNEECERFQLTEATVSSHPDHYEFLEAWDTGPGQDVKIGPDSNIYLSTGPYIHIYDFNGNFITEWTDVVHIKDINGIDFDSQGNLYAMESSSNQVVKFDSQGNFILAWGSSGEGEGKFMTTNRIACDSQDNVYVVDHDLNLIQKFNSTGNFIRSWNLPGGVGSLAIDSQDFIYVAGEYFWKYDADGNKIKEWETPLTSDGRFNDPHGLAVDSLDALYLTEIGVGRVQKFDSDGSFITEFGDFGDGSQGELSFPLGITVASNGLVYVIEEAEGRIKIYTPSIPEPTVIYPNGGETLNGTVWIQWTPSIDSFNNSITYSVYYSANNGKSWKILESGLKTTSYNWDTTALLYGVKYRIKVEAYSSIGSASGDISDDVFTIANNYFSSMFNTIIMPIFVAIVLLGLLFWMNRLVVRIEKEITD
jgi:hypothetical protein